MESFKEFVQNLPGVWSNTSWEGFNNIVQGRLDGVYNHAVSTINIPTKLASGKINKIYYTKNPIEVIISDGTTLKLSKDQWDYLKQIGREPMEQKNAQIEFYLDGTIKSFSLT